MPGEARSITPHSVGRRAREEGCVGETQHGRTNLTGKASHHAEGRFLAHWDEFLAHKKEVQLKFEEAFDMVQERRECEARLLRACQQLEAKMERCTRQAKESLSRGDAIEERVTTQTKNVEGCQEAFEGLREKTQRTMQELASALSSLRVEMAEAVDHASQDTEHRHQIVLEAVKRGDRCMADELLKKMNELNEKLGGNMLSLEEELARDVKKVSAGLDDFRKHVEASRQAAETAAARLETEVRDSIADTRAQAEQTSTQLGTQLTKATEDLGEVTARVEVAEGVQAEQVGRFAAVEARVSKVQETMARVEARSSAAEQSTLSKIEQLKDQLDDVGTQSSSGLLRARSEIDVAIREAVRAARDEFQSELRVARESWQQELQAIRDEVHSGVASCRERLQRGLEDSRAAVLKVKEEHQVMYHNVVNVVEGAQQGLADTRAETRAGMEALSTRLHEDLESRVGALREQIAEAREDVRETRRGAMATAEQTASILEGLNATRQRVSEASAGVSRAQAVAEEAAAETARLRSHTDVGLTEVRREVRAEAESAMERREAAFERQTRELREEVQHYLDTSRAEARERDSTLSKEAKDWARRMEQVEHTVEENAANVREQLRELARRQADSSVRLDECQDASRHSETGLTEVRCAMDDLRGDLDQMCRRLADEVKDLQDQSLKSQKQTVSDALCAAASEQRAELQTFRAVFQEQSADVNARIEQLSKQHRMRDDEVKREVEDVTAIIEERIVAVAANTRQLIQDHRQEARQSMARQLDERLQPLADRLSESAGECKAVRRSEADIGQRCDKLQKAHAELSAAQDAVAHQASATARELTMLRSEMRTELRNVAGGGLGAASEPQSPRWQDNQRETRGAEDTLRHGAWAKSLDSAIADTTARLAPRGALSNEDLAPERTRSASPLQSAKEPLCLGGSGGGAALAAGGGNGSLSARGMGAGGDDFPRHRNRIGWGLSGASPNFGHGHGLLGGGAGGIGGGDHRRGGLGDGLGMDPLQGRTRSYLRGRTSSPPMSPPLASGRLGGSLWQHRRVEREPIVF